MSLCSESAPPGGQELNWAWMLPCAFSLILSIRHVSVFRPFTSKDSYHGTSLGIWGQPGLQVEFRDRQGNIERHCLNFKKKVSQGCFTSDHSPKHIHTNDTELYMFLYLLWAKLRSRELPWKCFRLKTQKAVRSHLMLIDSVFRNT